MTVVTSARPAAAAPNHLDWPARDLLDGPRERWGALLRALLHQGAWMPLLRLCAGRLRVAGTAPASPVVFVANHASHADTVAVRAALGRRGRRRLAVAAADDYFFTTPRRARAVTAAIGAFAFPRHGDLGLRRAAALLRGGWSVLLYPQGTRDPGAAFRPGVLRLAAAGWTVVPLGIAGTGEVLPKGRWRPRRHRVAVVIGTPLAPSDVAGDLTAVSRAVDAAAAQAETMVRRPAASHPGILETTSQWLSARASSRTAPLLMFTWAVAEALVWPIIPDASLAILACSRPQRWWRLASAAALGSAVGGVAGWWAAAQAWTWPLPLTTDRMRDAAATWLEAGAGGLAHQPMSGVPYKVFVQAAPDAGIGVTDFVIATLQFRGTRFAATAAIAALLGMVLWRWVPRRWQRPAHGLISITAVSLLLAGLALVVRSWS